MDSKQRDDFVDDINDEYEEVREDHYDGLKVTLHIFQTIRVVYLHRQLSLTTGSPIRNVS